MQNKLFFPRVFAYVAVVACVVSLCNPLVEVHAQEILNATRVTYIVQLKDEKNSAALSFLGTEVQHRFSFSEAPQFRNIFTFTSVLPYSEIQKQLNGLYAYVQPDVAIKTNVVTVSQIITTNDPGFTTNAQDIDKEWGLAKVDFLSAWTKTTGSASNIVAVIDTGVDATHEDFKNVHFVPGFNFLTNQSIAINANSDDNGHGTLIAGVLGASANNGLGIVGTNWNISIMPLKVLDSLGKGDTANVAESLVWAVDHGATLINLSFGGIGFAHDTALSDAISYAFNKNAVIVAAAGNDVAATGGNLDQNPVFPVCDDNDQNMIIGVAATDQNDLKAAFSNYGKNCVDVSAPGKRILSTINHDPITKTSSVNSYAYASGTSLAVPFVVGEAALIRALYPSASASQIRDRIISTADSIDNLNLSNCGGSSCVGLLGSGRINAYAALQSGFSAQPLNDGDVVKVIETGLVYAISGGEKRLVSTFVFNQRYINAIIKTVHSSEVTNFPDGSYASPNEGTLLKDNNDNTVYIISKGLKIPITYEVFKQRDFDFNNVNTVTYTEISSWVTGNFLPPQEGTLVRGVKNKTVYWVVGQTLHPISYNFFVGRGLNIFPILVVPDTQIKGYAQGESYF